MFAALFCLLQAGVLHPQTAGAASWQALPKSGQKRESVPLFKDSRLLSRVPKTTPGSLSRTQPDKNRAIIGTSHGAGSCAQTVGDQLLHNRLSCSTTPRQLSRSASTHWRQTTDALDNVRHSAPWAYSMECDAEAGQPPPSAEPGTSNGLHRVVHAVESTAPMHIKARKKVWLPAS
eukprot:UN0005